MAYIVVTGYDKANKKCAVASLDEQFNITGTTVVMEEELGKLTVSKGMTPLNFSVDRTGKAKESIGSFSRLHPDGVFIAVAVIKTRSGKTLGYRVINTKTGTIENKKYEDLLNFEAQAKRPVMQNAIIRSGVINAYPMFVFPVIEVGTQKVTPKKEKPKKEVKLKEQIYTKEQEAEIAKCKKAGGNYHLISNPSFTPEQMHVLWKAHKDGSFAMVFANPALSVEQMKFFAPRTQERYTAQDCMLLAQHPELSIRHYVELYNFVLAGIDYEPYLTSDLGSIQLALATKQLELWGSSSPIKFRTDTESFQKFFNTVMKQQN